MLVRSSGSEAAAAAANMGAKTLLITLDLFKIAQMIVILRWVELQKVKLFVKLMRWVDIRELYQINPAIQFRMLTSQQGPAIGVLAHTIEFYLRIRGDIC